VPVTQVEGIYTRGGATRLPKDLVVALAGALVIALLSALSLSRHPPPYGFELAVGLGFLGVVALAIVHPEAAALLGFALLGVIVVEPAPADFVFLVVIAMTIATGRFRASVPPVAIMALGGFMALSLLSAVEVVDYRAAAFYLGISMYLALAALWLSGFVNSARRARIVAGGYLAAAVTSAALGVLALVAPLPGGELFVSAGRVHALFEDPNVFGPFLVPIALILLEDLLTPRLFAMRPLLKASLIGMLVLGVVLSYSRGAWINLLIGSVVLLAVLGLRRGGGRKVVQVALLASLVAGVVVLIVSATGSTSFLLERAHLQEYDSGRFAGQVAGIESAERYPLGIGPGQFESYASISAHSMYVRAFAEQGLPGLIVLTALLVSIVAAAIGNAAAGRETYGIGSAALLGALCGILVNSAVIDTLHWRHFWIVVALIWAGWARRRRLLRPRRQTEPGAPP
jgi:O-antigen ligase